jgi:hypothetical protein
MTVHLGDNRLIHGKVDISQKFRVKIMLKETNVHEIPEYIEARHCASEFYSER